SYEAKARWMDPNGKQVEQTRSVSFQPGQAVMIDFTQPLDESVSPPRPDAQSQQRTPQKAPQPAPEKKAPEAVPEKTAPEGTGPRPPPRQTNPGNSYQSGYPQQDQNIGLSSRITVRLPNPNAQLMLNGYPTGQRGMEREFESPPMQTGYNYSYEAKARWM